MPANPTHLPSEEELERGNELVLEHPQNRQTKTSVLIMTINKTEREL